MDIFKKAERVVDKLIDACVEDINKYFQKYFKNNENIYCIVLSYDRDYAEYTYREYTYNDFWELFEQRNCIRWFPDNIKVAYDKKIEYDELIFEYINDNVEVLQEIVYTDSDKFFKHFEDIHPQLFNEIFYSFDFHFYSKLDTVVCVRGIGVL